MDTFWNWLIFLFVLNPKFIDEAFCNSFKGEIKQPYLVQICLRKFAPVDARPWNSFLLLPALIWTAHSVVAFNSPNNHKFTKNITVHCSIQNKPDIDNLSHCLWCGSVLSRQNNKLYNRGGRENLERENERGGVEGTYYCQQLVNLTGQLICFGN